MSKNDLDPDHSRVVLREVDGRKARGMSGKYLHLQKAKGRSVLRVIFDVETLRCKLCAMNPWASGTGRMKG
jgi:hypothetical protein